MLAMLYSFSFSEMLAMLYSFSFSEMLAMLYSFSFSLVTIMLGQYMIVLLQYIGTVVCVELAKSERKKLHVHMNIIMCRVSIQVE